MLALGMDLFASILKSLFNLESDYFPFFLRAELLLTFISPNVNGTEVGTNCVMFASFHIRFWRASCLALEIPDARALLKASQRFLIYSLYGVHFSGTLPT